MLLQLVTLQVCARTAAALGGPALPPKLRAIEQSLRGAHDAKAAFRTEELFRGCDREQLAPAPATVARGAVPGDLRGAILRNGPNARPWGSGGGWLDGDGMVHAVVLGDEGATYSRAWLRTAAFAKEEAAGPGKLFDGSLVAPQGFKLLVNLAKNFANALQPQKDTANTALVALADGRCLGLMEQCKPCEFRISSDGTLETLAAGSTLGGGIESGPHPLSGGALTAHFHGDPVTEELVGVTYSSTSQPYGRVDFLDARTGEITRTIGVDMRSPVMLHDSAISRKHVIILDLPLTVRPARMLLDRFPVEYEPDFGARLGLTSRETGETRWVDVEPGVVLHTVSAHENGDGATVLRALRSLPDTPTSFIGAYTPAFLYEWVVDGDACVRERYLSSVPVEFPAIDPRCVGSAAPCAYAIRPVTIGGPNRYGPPAEGILIDAVVKFDLADLHDGDAATSDADCVAAEWVAPAGYFVVSEPSVVPKRGGRPGDGAYVLVFVTNVHDDGETRDSKLVVLDGDALAEVCELDLPNDVPYGLHSAWVDWADLAH